MNALGRLFTIVLFLLPFNKSLFAQCPDVGATRKRIASSFHSSIMIDHTDAVKYWGESASPTAAATNVLSPATLSNTLYSGTPLAVAASSIVTGTNGHQYFLLTSAALYGWGSVNGSASSTVANASYVTIAPMALPATLNGITTTITPANVAFITASGGGLAIVLKVGSGTNGEVFVRNPSAMGGGVGATYGDGTGAGAMNTAWHQVKTNSTTYLSGITRLSYSQKGLMALAQNNAVYSWGQQVWAGNVAAAGDYSYATPITTLPAGVTPADINIISRTRYSTQDTLQYATQFILGTNGRLYGIGEGYRGILGQGNSNDAAGAWVTVKSPDGTGFLENIVQISSNNTYVYFNELSNQNYYSIGALNSDGQLYLWGDNSKSMIGGAAGTYPFYSLPAMPPNFNVNDARVGYIHMGGHTTVAFLKGTNRFCYIGHRVNGSMGDGTSADNINPSYDCINTPSAYICPPPAPLGCATASANDLLASSVNATVVINGQPAVTYWGQSSSSAELGQNVPLPRTLYEYNGTPKGVAAGGVSLTNGTQMWILSTEGLWGWGYSANTISAVTSNVGLTKAELPAGVAITDVSFIRAAKGGIALVTNSGTVWIKAGAGSACAAAVYGDNAGALDNAWHQVLTTAGTPLTGVAELSFGGTAALAITGTGTAYVWGVNTYLGNNTAMATRTRAEQLSLHSDFTGTVAPRTAEIIQSGAYGAAQFILATNGKVYSLGDNRNGVLGIGSTTAQTTWSSLSLAGVHRLSSNNSYPNGTYSIGALTMAGTLYLWGSNADGMLGAGAATQQTTPYIPALTPLGAGVMAVDNVNGFEMGGRQTIIFPKPNAVNPDNKFLFAGYNNGGAKGDAATPPTAAAVTEFTYGASVVNCAGAVYSLRGHVYYDRNGLNDAGGGLISGDGINTVSGAPTLYINLLDETGLVVNTTTLGTNGSYSFSGLPAATYTVQAATSPGALYNPAPASGLPASWAFVGEQVGVVAGEGINTGATAATGRLSVTLSNNAANVNIGLEGRPVADTKSFTIDDNQFYSSSKQQPADYPVRPGFRSICAAGNAFASYASSAKGSLSGSDAEDCTAAGSCNTGTNSTFLIKTIKPNTQLWYLDNGSATQLTAGQLVPKFVVGNLLIYGQVGTGNTTNALGFTYSLVDAAGAESIPAGYSITTGTQPLPTVLTSFTATPAPGCAALLRWTTGVETTISRFELQHSTDGQGFTTFATVPAGNAAGSYQAIHSAVANGSNYYRLLLQERDGSVSFSKVAVVQTWCNSRAAVTAAPNPTSGSLQLANLATGDEATLYTAMGTPVQTLTATGNGQYVLNLYALPAGIYLLRVKDASGAVILNERISKR